MTCWAITPIKAPQNCKTRLQPALSETARLRLVANMLRHVVETTSAALHVDKVYVLGPSRHALPHSTPRLADRGAGLNDELTQALHVAAKAGVDRVIIIAADLPKLTSHDVDALAMLGADVCAIAPDRKRSGTNALSLPLPAAADFKFQFGANSFALHSAEIERLALNIAAICSPTLALDIDEPNDLADVPEALRA